VQLFESFFVFLGNPISSRMYLKNNDQKIWIF